MSSTSYTDLTDRIGPVLVKELRQNLRRYSFIYPFLCIHLFAIAAIFFEFKFEISSGGSTPAIFFWDPDHIGPFWWVAMIVIGFLMPLTGFFLMPQEIEEGNHEILLLTQINRWQIVFGKFMTLWMLCLLTLTSLLPYIIIRYFIGGVEWLNESANAVTVISVSAIISSLSIAASGYPNMGSKLGVLLLMLFSASTGGGIGMIGGAIWMDTSKTSHWSLIAITFYHLSAIIMVAGYVILGLLVARSRLRLAILNFEIKPSSLLLIIIGLAPFIVGMVAAFTCGFGSILGVVLLTFLAWHSDKTPKAPKWMGPAKANIPSVIPSGIPVPILAPMPATVPVSPSVAQAAQNEEPESN